MVVFTTVSGHFNGNHLDPETGTLHGHDYVVEATWVYDGQRFEKLQELLAALMANLDHERLPDRIWAAEDLAVWLRNRLACKRVRVSRMVLGHFVEVCEE